MSGVLLVQLPIPGLNYGIKTGNIPLGAAFLKQAVSELPNTEVEILPESVVSYLGDSAIINIINSRKADILGFTVYAWNIERTLYIAEKIKEVSNVRIVLGGPEVTRDNKLLNNCAADFLVYGEGEEIFRRLLSDDSIWSQKSASESCGLLFSKSKSPYIDGLLEPWVENIMLLETQRGCPYHCGFCYYNKSRSKLSFTGEESILSGVRWAVDNKIEELYLLDPSLNARKDLNGLLKKIAEINRDGKVAINSEIRAEAVDDNMADLFLEAGFVEFEIGLQSTTKKALELMRRPTDLKKFLNGALLLKERGIMPRIDLIMGLPGDTLEGFGRSVGFVSEHDLIEDIQAFPLSVLPGTDFRAKSRELGLVYDPNPPYTIIETDTFSKEDMLLAHDYAESAFDVSLYSFPDLDLSWRYENFNDAVPDTQVFVGKEKYINKIILNCERPFSEIKHLSKKLTMPWQLFIMPELRDENYIIKAIEILSMENPFSPFEVVFLSPNKIPDTNTILSHTKLKRPAFLDNDLRYLYAIPGNRSLLFTLISEKIEQVFRGDMHRQIYKWERQNLPEQDDFNNLMDLDGVYIAAGYKDEAIEKWQNNHMDIVSEILPVTFEERFYQNKWREKSSPGEYFNGAFKF